MAINLYNSEKVDEIRSGNTYDKTIGESSPHWIWLTQSDGTSRNISWWVGSQEFIDLWSPANSWQEYPIDDFYSMNIYGYYVCAPERCVVQIVGFTSTMPVSTNDRRDMKTIYIPHGGTVLYSSDTPLLSSSILSEFEGDITERWSYYITTTPTNATVYRNDVLDDVTPTFTTTSVQTTGERVKFTLTKIGYEPYTFYIYPERFEYYRKDVVMPVTSQPIPYPVLTPTSRESTGGFSAIVINVTDQSDFILNSNFVSNNKFNVGLLISLKRNY